LLQAAKDVILLATLTLQDIDPGRCFFINDCCLPTLTGAKNVLFYFFWLTKPSNETVYIYLACYQQRYLYPVLRAKKKVMTQQQSIEQESITALNTL